MKPWTCLTCKPTTSISKNYYVVELTRTWTWKSCIVAIFFLFLTLWHVLTYKQADATLASLSILKYEALKWPHRVIRGSKIKSASILFKSMSDRQPWLKNSKNVTIFSNATRDSDVRCCKRSKVSIHIVRGVKKLSCSDFPENGGILFFYLLQFRKRIVCTTSNVSFICFRSKCCRSPFSQWQ